MSIIQKIDGTIDLYEIENLLLSCGAQITFDQERNLTEDEAQFTLQQVEYLAYRNYSNMAAERRIINVEAYLPIPIELFICWIALDKRYHATVFTITCNNESLHLKISISNDICWVRMVRPWVRRHFKVRKIKDSLLIGHIFCEMAAILYQMQGPSNGNISRHSKLWIQTIEQLFLTKYISPYKLEDILSYHYDIQIFNLPYIFDLNVINIIPIFNEADYYFLHSDKLDSSMNLELHELNVAIRPSEKDKLIRIVPLEILESETVFNIDNQPCLKDITIYGIHHVYRYIELVFKQGISSEDEQREVAEKFGLTLTDHTYTDIIKILNKI